MKRRISNITIGICLVTGFLLLIISVVGIHEQLSCKAYYCGVRDKVFDEDNFYNESKLKELYPNAIAWIEIPGTNVNYPVVMATRDYEYYLTHDAGGKKSRYGSIFTDIREKNNPFEYKNCIIYGHNMGRWSNTMFSSLKKYESKSYYNKHKYVNIYREGKYYKYLIISVHRANEKSSIYEINPDSFNEWLEDNINLSKYPCDEVEDGVSSIVTLSTCSNEGDDRIVIIMALCEKNR